jgi:hypothetical protein
MNNADSTAGPSSNGLGYAKGSEIPPAPKSSAKKAENEIEIRIEFGWVPLLKLSMPS